MKLEIETKELKQAVSATCALVKKMPAEMSSGDAKIAFLRDTTGFSIVAAFDYFTSSIAIPSATIVGADNGDFEPWGEQGPITEMSVFGIIKDAELTALLSKLAGTKKLVVDLDREKQIMTIGDGENKSYRFDLRPPKKVMAMYYRAIGGESMLAMNKEQFEWFCSTVSTLGKMVKPSAGKPGYGNVCLSAFPSDQKPLQISGNSDSDGYSMIYDTLLSSRADFTALMPKITSESLNTYLSQFGGAPSEVDMHVSIGEDGKATSVAFIADSFSLSLSCMTDEFPFKALGRIISMVENPAFEESFNQAELKKTTDRLGIFAKTENAATVVELLDGGTVTLSQKMDAISRAVDAKEDCPAIAVLAFQKDSVKESTVVLTNVLQKGLTLFPAKSEIKMGIAKAPNETGNGKLALHGSDGIATITAVIMGLRV